MKTISLPFSLAPHQRRWLALMEHRTCAILAARGAAKTWTVAFKMVQLAFAQPWTQVNIIPGSRQDQGCQAIRYCKEIISASPVLMRQASTPWTTMALGLKNGSTITVKAPTEGGVNSSRGWLFFDEAQGLNETIGQKALPIASKKGNHLCFIGTPEYPSWFYQLWEKLAPEEKDIVEWPEAVAAGIIDQEAIDCNRRLMSNDMFDAQYNCKWVHKDTFRFDLHAWTGGIVAGTSATGVDCNLNPGFAWVKVARDEGGRLIAVDEGVFKKLEEIGHLPELNKVMIEDLGFNTGFASEAPKYSKIVRSDPWGEQSKKEVVEFAKVQNDKSNLFFLPNSCPKLKKGIDELKFDVNGKMDKPHSGDCIHFIDAWLHALNGARAPARAISGTNIQRMIFK